MPLTPADVHNVAFKKPPIGKRGYDEEEVDKFLDEIEAEMARLIEENNTLHDRPDAVPAQRTGQAAPVEVEEAAPEAQPDQAMSARIHELEQDNERLSGDNTRLVQEHDQLSAQQAELTAQVDHLETQAREAAAQASEAPAPVAPPSEGEQALSVLMTAQRTANEHVAAARAEADKLLSGAHEEADELTGHARTDAEDVTRKARNEAEALEQDARQRHQEAMGGLEIRRAALQKHIEELKVFASDYRTRIQAYLEGQLRDLNTRGQEMESADQSVHSNGGAMAAQNGGEQ